MLRAIQRRLPALLALSFAAGFVAVASIQLEGQGLHYDELHQAPAAFAWVGKEAPFFNLVQVWGIPLLNMSYSGALKSTLFGWWLRLSGAPFSVVSWRMAGILLGGLGVGVLTASGRRKLPITAHLLLGALILGDVSLLVLCRPDWGPVALGFLLRALFVSAWVTAETSPESRRRYALAMGALVGVAIFEKLSSVVLVVPLAVCIAMSPRLRTRTGLVSAGTGLVLGLLPLAMVNAVSWKRSRSLVSLGGLEHRELTWESLASHLKAYSTLGPGEQALDFVLASAPAPWAATWNAAAMCVALVIIIVAGVRAREGLGRLAAAAAVSWLGIGVALWLLPRGTWIHHWLAGTPFQYTALALGAAAWPLQTAGPGDRWRERLPQLAWRSLLAGCVGVVVLTGLIGLLGFGRAVARGAHGEAWSPDLTSLGRAAGRQGEGATFIAADWGVATQIYCLSNGRAGLVSEPFWEYQGVEALARLLAERHAQIFYVVGLHPRSEVAPDATRRIFEDAARLPGWREGPVEPEMARLVAVEVRKYLAVTPEPRPGE